ncbi:MAG: phage holin family protein [Chloroflexi bacterium]|nr:phage holin family protein [Chloroflexota bacterium]
MVLRNFLIRLVINAFAITLTATLLPGIQITNDFVTVLLIALVFGIVNAIVKPFLILLTCPAVLLTFGLFILVINALMLMLTASIVGEAFIIDGFGWALLGGIIMGLISILIDSIIGGDDDNRRSEIHIERF